MEKRLIPEIRFKGFKGNWEEKRLGDIANIVGGGTPSTKIESYWNGEINWFTPSEISDERYAYESKRKITEEGLKKSSAKILPKDKTILFTSRATIGLMAILKKDSSTNQGFQSIVLKDEKKTNIYFLFSQKHKFEKYGFQRAYGSTFLEISGREMRNMIISLPEIDEQEKIGRLFEKLDQTIDLQGKVLEENKRLKGALLQKLFPQKGQKLPELRLKGFSGDWEEKNFGEIFNLKTAKNKNEFISEDGDKLIMDMGAVSEFGYNIARKKTNTSMDLLKIGDLIMPKDDIGGGLIIGKTAYIDEDDRYVQGDHVYKIESKNSNVSNLFFHYQINNRTFNREIKRITTGSAQLGIKASNINKIKVFFPSLPEQEAIGNLFRSLDEKIKREEERLEGHKTLKKALLQKMFV